MGHKSLLGFKGGGNMDSASSWEKRPSHIVRRTGRMGDFAVAIFGKYTLPRPLGVVLCDQGRRGDHGLWNRAAWTLPTGCVTGQVRSGH